MLDWLRCHKSKIIRSKYGIILLIISANILLGFFIVDNYGQSWDEVREVNYGIVSLKTYVGFADSNFPGYARQQYHGPFYDMLSVVGAKVFSALRPEWLNVDAGHFTYFLSFQIALFSLYTLSLKFSSKISSLVAALLFMTQPVLFGHAFINPKDMPFMAFFLATIALGFAMSDSFRALSSQSTAIRSGDAGYAHQGLWLSVLEDWKSASLRSRILVIGLLTIGSIISIDVLFLNRFLLPRIQSIVYDAYHNASWELINRWFHRSAEYASQTPVVIYIEEVTQIYWRARVPAVIALFAPGVVAGGWVFAPTLKRMWTNTFYRFLFLGAVLLGFSTSIRLFAPFAGVLVSAYFILTARARSLRLLPAYWVIAAIACYITWPFLWNAPVVRFRESFSVMSAFPWDNLVLYRGMLFRGGELPWDYVPFLLTVQFTEPVVPLCLLGLFIGLRKAQRQGFDGLALVLILLWIGVPLAAVSVMGIPVYDNFRHLLYVVPPIFILVSIGVDAILSKLKSRILSVITIGVVLVPGIAGITTLHPYEYIYYNALVGGVRGAFRNYELDYWCTSYREAIAVVNTVASPNAEIAVWGPSHAAQPFARTDLVVYRWKPDPWIDTHDPEFAIISSRTNFYQKFFPDSDVVWQVTKGDAVLAVVKEVRSVEQLE